MLLGLFAPVAVFAAPSSFEGARSLLAASSSPGNAYVAGATVTVTAPTGGDLTALGGSVTLAADVKGDALLAAGSVSSRAPVSGDLRVVGGSVSIDEAVGGDIAAAGFSVHDAARAGGSVFIAAADASLTVGAHGPVTVYSNSVTLGGTFDGDVDVVSSGRVTLLASTTIAGKLTYDAPEAAIIPASADIRGGVAYTNASYLPAARTSRTLALASIGIFLLARILGALILAGLLAGLFPRLSEAVTERAWAGRTRTVLLTMLLGFAALVATPILLVLLALTFIGLGISILLFITYCLLAILSFMYAGIMLGALIARRFEKRASVRWRDGVLGMLLLSIVALVPVIGTLALFLLMAFAAGALILLFFQFAFPHEDGTTLL